jgi:hypothetical protein
MSGLTVNFQNVNLTQEILKPLLPDILPSPFASIHVSQKTKCFRKGM